MQVDVDVYFTLFCLSRGHEEEQDIVTRHTGSRLKSVAKTETEVGGKWYLATDVPMQVR